MRAGEADETDDQARSNDVNCRSGRDCREYDGDQSDTELGGGVDQSRGQSGAVVLLVGVAHGGKGDVAQHVADLTGDSSVGPSIAPAARRSCAFTTFTALGRRLKGSRCQGAWRRYCAIPTPRARVTGGRTTDECGGAVESYQEWISVQRSDYEGHMMLLEGKTAIVYGAAGAVGSAVAQAFAREGAALHLTGHHLGAVQALADQIAKTTGAVVQTAQVDALNPGAVERHASSVVATSGRLDISFNVISLGDAQGAALVDSLPDHFMLPIDTAMRAHFITATTAVRHMRNQQSGVILALTAQAARKPYPDVGGFGVACAALEALCRQLAAEAGPLGIRVVCLRSAGSPDTPGVAEAWSRHAKTHGVSLQDWTATMAATTLLKRLPRLAEVANAAALMASDHASGITGAITNLTCGELVD